MLNRIMKMAARVASRLPMPVVRFLGGRAISVDGRRLDPRIQFMVKYFTGAPGVVPPVHQMRHDFDVQGDWLSHDADPSVTLSSGSFLSEVRKAGTDAKTGKSAKSATAVKKGKLGKATKAENATLPSMATIPYEIHRPKGLPRKNAPALIFYHGGGHCAGSLVSHRNVCNALAAQVGCAVIAIDYRLAPENRFPLGINDCLNAFDFVAQHAESLGFDPSRIAVGGDSAGGNISAVVAQARKKGRHRPKLQVLWVPWVDLSRQSRSYELFEKGFFLDKATMEWYTRSYLNSAEEAKDPLASPLLGNCKGVCPAIVLVAGFDPLRDEGIAYAKKLEEAGVPTTLRVFDGLVHPFINVGGFVAPARQAFDEAVTLIRAHL